MNLSPRDLGTEHFASIVRRRLSPLAPYASGQTNQKHANAASKSRSLRTRLLNYWLRDLGLDDTTHEKIAEVVGTSPSYSANIGVAVMFSVMFMLPALTMLIAGAPSFITIFFLLMWGLMMWATLFAPRMTLRQVLQKPVTTGEIETLLSSAQGRLDRSYLTLVLDATRHNGTLSASAQSDIRAALAALGDAISRLPSGPVPTADPTVLRREAEEFRLQAGRENDAFVRASFLRQAESLEKRADLGLENATSARRISALRREARTQMDALRALLAAFSQTNPGEAAQNVALADAVSRVAGEAQSLSQAHRELADAEIAALLGHPLPANIPVQPAPATQPQTYPTRQPAGGSQPNAPQQQQVGSGRPWWRG